MDLGEHVLFVHAHPDDETLSTGAAIATIAQAGTASVLTLTLGERGEVRPERAQAAQDAGSLAALRSVELDRAIVALGATRVEPEARFEDSGMAWVDGVAAPSADVTVHALTSQRDSDVELLVLDAVQRVRPAALVTYDEDGGYGHPDHRAVHRAVVAVGRDLRIPVYVRAQEPADVAVPLAPVADRVREALAAHASQLAVDGDAVVHVGGQREPIAQVEHYRAVRSSTPLGWGSTVVVGLVALVVGTVGTFTFRAVEPWGLVLALAAAVGIVVGPRLLGSRIASIAASVGVLVPIAIVALDPFRTAGSAGLLEADLAGWLWVLVPAAAALVAMGWPTEAGMARIREAARG
ncbi:PIG-L family deacetylase [Agrococcus jejuensis]|uniref:GlcNAc-PI de-N-acetylase n=1 Tax=Agrococcus jejuensis TaxID=399736 RepID=A0A1G8G5S2_9MICO|nr:PIG-L family deacetylase [Agrococcus jejuensis]SDH89754.1 GlcNAc-PI de-N-acetylase [Agrococcus jejuensis]